MNGFINFMKPPGMTSSDGVVQFRRRLGKIRLGHGGTLDPEAAGVLPLMLGKATRLFEELVDKDKEYIAEWMPGVATDTLDATGVVVERTNQRPTRAAVEAVLPQFFGEIWQTPPAYSAIKLGGEAAYARARRGELVEIPRRIAQIHALEILGETPRGGLMLRICCGKGTYIRTLCADLGAALGCPAHMAFLLRTRSGIFTLEQAVTLEEGLAALEDGYLEALLTPMDAPLHHFPRLEIPVSWHAKARCGNAMPVPIFQEEIPLDQPVRLYMGEEFAGVGLRDGDHLKFRTMLL